MKIDLKKIEHFVTRRKVAFIASTDEEGYPNLKAMLMPRKIEGLHTFYFSTNTSSMRVRQYRANPRACIYFYCKVPFNYRGVMLVGTMEVLEDEITKRAMWSTGDKTYYPLGVTDPDYCILKFTAIGGRYYHNLKTGSFKL
jgi:general stress protein 26